MSNGLDTARRRFLTGAATVVGGTGAACAAWPFASAWQPSERAKAIGAPVEVDFAKLEPGARLTVKWRGKPVWIVRRTTQALASLPDLATGRCAILHPMNRSNLHMRAMRTARSSPRYSC